MTADPMPSEDVPAVLVDDAVDAWHDAPRNEHGVIALDDHMRVILAAVLPAHEATVRTKLSAELIERGSREPVTSGFRRGLRAAANIVAPDPTAEEIMQAIRDGNFVACHLNDDGTPRGEGQ